MNRTTIDWPGLTHTWNPIVGCSMNCDYCYARRLHDKRHKAFLEGKRLPPQYAFPYSQLQFFYNRLGDPLRHKEPSKIFIGSVCDIFDPAVPNSWIYEIIKVVQAVPRHTFMILTKQPSRVGKFRWPANCQIGVTVESAKELYRIDQVFFDKEGFNNGFQKNKKFASVEPIQGPFPSHAFNSMDLVIVGADSNVGAPIPPLEWIESVKHHNIHYKNNIIKHYPHLKKQKQCLKKNQNPQW